VDITLDTDAPRSPEYTRAVAAAIPEAVGCLNHATIGRPRDALGQPATADAVIRDLHLAAQRMPQLFDQLRRWLAAEHDAGRISGAAGRTACARLGVDQAAARLWDAAAAAAQLEQTLAAAAAATSTLTVPYGNDQES
jgi:hypothetical protein